MEDAGGDDWFTHSTADIMDDFGDKVFRGTALGPVAAEAHPGLLPGGFAGQFAGPVDGPVGPALIGGGVAGLGFGAPVPLLPSDAYGNKALLGPTTVSVSGLSLTEVRSLTEEVLTHLQMAFAFLEGSMKFVVAGYYPTGFARMRIRIWRRLTPGHLAVEVMRDRGDRLVVLRFFDALSRALMHGAAASDEDFSPAMFDWTPRPLPDSFLAALLPVPTSTLEAGVVALVDLVKSEFDDVAVNGCSSVAKLATASEATALHLAQSPLLLQALVDVVAAGLLSMDTLTNAALALSELSTQPLGQGVLAAKCGGAALVAMLASKASILASDDEDVDVACFKRYCATILTNLCLSVDPVVRAAVSAERAAVTAAFASCLAEHAVSYPPLVEQGYAGTAAIGSW